MRLGKGRARNRCRGWDSCWIYKWLIRMSGSGGMLVARAGANELWHLSNCTNRHYNKAEKGSSRDHADASIAETNSNKPVLSNWSAGGGGWKDGQAKGQSRWNHTTEGYWVTIFDGRAQTQLTDSPVGTKKNKTACRTPIWTDCIFPRFILRFRSRKGWRSLNEWNLPALYELDGKEETGTNGECFVRKNG